MSEMTSNGSSERLMSLTGRTWASHRNLGARPPPGRPPLVQRYPGTTRAVRHVAPHLPVRAGRKPSPTVGQTSTTASDHPTAHSEPVRYSSSPTPDGHAHRPAPYPAASPHRGAPGFFTFPLQHPSHPP